MIQVYVATFDVFWDVNDFAGPHEYDFRHHFWGFSLNLCLNWTLLPSIKF
jgi:hypothetical protein